MAVTPSRINNVHGYTIYQIGLHWLIAALVFAQLIFGESMTAAVAAIEEGEPVSALDGFLAGMHYYSGITILVLVAVRLALRVKNGVPPPPATNAAIELAGRISHWLFYGMLVVVPITGLLGYYYGDPIGEWHTYAKPVFIALIAVHVTAALYRQF